MRSCSFSTTNKSFKAFKVEAIKYKIIAFKTHKQTIFFSSNMKNIKNQKLFRNFQNLRTFMHIDLSVTQIKAKISKFTELY
jgi:hypothetical protein